MCVYDMAFIDVMNGFDGVCYFLFSVVVDTDIFSDTVEPAVERSVCAEGVDCAKRFYPGLLCQVLCGLSIFDASQNVRIEAGLVCGDKWSKRFGVAVLGAFNEVSFVDVRQPCVSFHFNKGLGLRFRVLFNGHGREGDSRRYCCAGCVDELFSSRCLNKG